jgi:hypothetical protein
MLSTVIHMGSWFLLLSMFFWFIYFRASISRSFHFNHVEYSFVCVWYSGWLPHLSLSLFSLFFSCDLALTLPSYPWTVILLFLPSEVAGITGMYHHILSNPVQYPGLCIYHTLFIHLSTDPFGLFYLLAIVNTDAINMLCKFICICWCDYGFAQNTLLILWSICQ